MGLKYECRQCGAIKTPDGRGCQCGASYGSLRVVNDFDRAMKEGPHGAHYHSPKLKRWMEERLGREV